MCYRKARKRESTRERERERNRVWVVKAEGASNGKNVMRICCTWWIAWDDWSVGQAQVHWRWDRTVSGRMKAVCVGSCAWVHVWQTDREGVGHCFDSTPVVCIVLTVAKLWVRSSGKHSDKMRLFSALSSGWAFAGGVDSCTCFWSESVREAVVTPGYQTTGEEQKGKSKRDWDGGHPEDDDMKKRYGWRRGAESTACFTCRSGNAALDTTRLYLSVVANSSKRTPVCTLCVYAIICSNHSLKQVNSQCTSYTPCLQFMSDLVQQHIKHHSYLNRYLSHSRSFLLLHHLYPSDFVW